MKTKDSKYGETATSVVWLTLIVLITLNLPLAANAKPRAPAKAAVITGTVKSVVDGDSLWFAPAATVAEPKPAPIEVRLVDMDAPEICQSGGPEAKQALQALVAGKTVRLKSVARDRYGRTLAKLVLSGEQRQIDVATDLVESGWAYSARGRNGQGPLMKKERMARALGRGVHGMPGAVLPSEFRRSNGSCKTALAAPAEHVA
jgi:micrococcal nuclease